jgi:hypothetical protein
MLMQCFSYISTYFADAKVVSSNPAHAEVYTIQHRVKFVSDLRQVGGFLDHDHNGSCSQMYIIFDIFLGLLFIPAIKIVSA